ncbi:polyprenyl synthetase family protein [Limosilactobacillus gastricus]|uniref:polyprenyl synthetase family protein n=1 Tax=Limosilactobacillus gastricus TaxID=227942 RepID=UPI0026EEAD8D|nr:farnesyl diphosphate synthase [Limosilactobacillus gastricus]
MQTLSELQAQVNQYLLTNLVDDIDEATLSAAMNYSVDAGGKRLRPTMTLMVAQILGVELNSDVLRAACALELLHTYSLIHDDLPAMDNDDLRRGKPTSHKQFGEAIAILAGDGLLTLAFQWLTDNQLSANVKARLTLELSKAAGPVGMVAGQVRDILSTGKTLSIERLQKLHAQKTGALLKYATVAGGVIAEVGDEVVAELANFGALYGLAFQIYDDILDVTATSADLGKATHKDAERGKNSYPALLGLPGAEKKLSQVLTAAKVSQERLTTLTQADFSRLDELLAYYN